MFCSMDDCLRALMFAASKFDRKLPAIDIVEQDAELLSRVNVELQQYIVNMDNVKFVLHIFYRVIMMSTRRYINLHIHSFIQ